MNNASKFKYLYFSLAISMLVIECLDLTLGRLIIKPLLMLTLILYISVDTKNFFARNLMLLALFFAFLGDVFLLPPDNSNFFILGLIAFLLTHIIYTFIFSRDFIVNHTYLSYKLLFAMVVCVLFVVVLFYHFLLPFLGNMAVPVTIYILVISFMLFSAMFRSNNVVPESFVKVLIGCCFFLISDSLLAVNQFAIPFNYARVVVMLTYMIAQYLIVNGMKIHFINREYIYE